MTDSAAHGIQQQESDGNSEEQMNEEFESPHNVPQKIGRDAWQAAMTIDEEVHKFMAECGLFRVEGRSKMTEAIAGMVQLAINRVFARIDLAQQLEDAMRRDPDWEELPDGRWREKAKAGAQPESTALPVTEKTKKHSGRPADD